MQATKLIKQSIRRRGNKVIGKIEFEITTDKWFDVDCAKERLENNCEWLLHHMVTWARWDYCFTVELLKDALWNLGKGLGIANHLVSSQRNSRRCMAAAKMLEQAHEYANYEDKSYRNWASRQVHHTVPIRVKGVRMYEMKTEQLSDNAMGMDKDQYSTKMWHIIHKRTTKVEEERWKDAWNFIQKYLRYWWD